MKPMRERQISLRFSEEEWTRAEAVAAAHGLNVQNVIRAVLKKESDEVANDNPTAACRHQLWNAKVAFDDALRADRIDESLMGDVLRSFTELERLLVRAGFVEGLDAHRKARSFDAAGAAYFRDNPDATTFPPPAAKPGRKAVAMRNAKVAAARRSPTAKP